MTDHADRSHLAPIPLGAARQIHDICLRYESAWRGSRRPALDQFLADVEGRERVWLLEELVALEVDLRRQAGEQPDEAEYRRTFPGEAEHRAIASAFQRCADLCDELSASAAGDRPAEADGGNGESRGGPVPTIEGYEVIGVIGRGGMGVVYKARDLRLKRLVALKMILGREHASEEMLARFRLEAETVARLQHPNIVQVFEVGAQDGHPYLAFEYVEGQTLAEYTAREPQPARLAAEVVEALAHAMQYAHQQGVVHRDLKPANVLLAAGGQAGSSNSGGSSSSRRAASGLHAALSGQHATSTGLVPKITDFGLAKDLAANSEYTSTGAILGTPNYMSPEQANSRRDIGPSTDIHALGVILYVLLTGRPPFQGTTPIATLKMVIGSEPVAPVQLQPGLAKDLETICLKCLHKDPGRRYESAGALADDLRRFLNDEPILARASGRFEKAFRWCRRNPALAISLAAVLLALVAGVVVSNGFAIEARREAALARQAEEDARQREQAEIAARQDADRQRERAERAIAEALLDEGLVHCENQELARGLLTMVEALEQTPPVAVEMTEAIRLNLAFWQGPLSVLKATGGYQSAMTATAFAPDGKSFVTGDWGNHQNVLGPPYLLVRDTQNNEPIERITEHTAAIWRVAYAPDGQRFASASFDGTARLWDAATRQPVGSPLQHAGRVYALAFSPDSRQLLTGSQSAEENFSELRVWRADTGTEEGEPVRLPGKQRAVAWSSDGKLWASGSAMVDSESLRIRGGEIRFWDADTRQPHGEPLPQTDPVLAVAFRPETNVLAAGTEDGLVRFWDPATGQRIGKMLLHRDPVNALEFNRDGRFLLTASGENRPGLQKRGEARLWNVNTGQLVVQPLIHPAKVNDVALSPDQHSVIAACEDGLLYVWQIGGPIIPDYIVRESGLRLVGLTPNGETLITLGANDSSREIVVRHWEAATGRTLGEPLRIPYTVLLANAPDRIQGLRAIHIRPDGRWAGSAEWLEVAVGHERQGDWFFWDTVSHEPVPIPDEVKTSDKLAFSRDGRRLAAGKSLPDGSSLCRVWDVERWQLVGKPIQIHSHLYSLLFSADGQSLLTGTQDGFVRRWSLENGQLLVASEQLDDDLRSLELRLSPNATRLLTVRHNSSGVAASRIVEPLDLTPVGPDAYCQADWLFTGRFVPDGRRYVGFGHGPVHVWDGKTGEHIRTLNRFGSVGRRYAAQPSGTYLALGVTPNQVRLWHLDTGKLIGPALNFPDVIEQLEFSPDGGALYVACQDETLRRLQLPTAMEGSLAHVKADIQRLTQRRLGIDGGLLATSDLDEEGEARGASEDGSR